MNTVKFESLPHSRVRLSIVIPVDEVRAQYRTTIEHYMKTIVVKGFRKGHVPQNIILSRFADGVREDALERTVQAGVRAALDAQGESKAHELLEYDPPRLTSKPKYDPDQPLKVEVEFDTVPKFKLPQYTGLQIRIPKIEIDEQAIGNELTKLQQGHALYHPRGADEAAENGDAVVVDLHDDKENRRPDMRFIIGNDDAPTFSDQLIGMQTGQQKELTQDNAPPAGAGNDGSTAPVVTATLTAIQRRELPVIDDAFAAKINDKFASLDELKTAIRGELEAHYRKQLEQTKRTNFLHLLANQFKVELPRAMIEREKQYMWHRLLEQYKMTEERLLETLAGEGKSQIQLFQDWDADTTQRLKEALILRELQQREQIKVESGDINAFIATQAAENGHDPQTLKQLYIDNKKMGNVIESCAEDLIFKRLFEKNSFIIDKKLKID